MHDLISGWVAFTQRTPTPITETGHALICVASRPLVARTHVRCARRGGGRLRPANSVLQQPWRLVRVIARARQARLRPSSHTITAAELGSFPTNSVYEIVSRLRPEFLRRDHDAVEGSADPTVYIDGLVAGPVSTLLSIPADAVAEIHYITAVDAFLLHGSTQRGGIIFVRMRRR